MQLLPVVRVDDCQLDYIAINDNLTDVLEIDSDLVAVHCLHAAKTEANFGRMADQCTEQDMQRFGTPRRGATPAQY